MSAAPFDLKPVLQAGDFTLSPLTEADFEDVRIAAADPEIWAGHPAKDRWKPEVFRSYIQALFERGGALVFRDGSGEVVGLSRFYECDERPGCWGIGYTFLVTRLWGGAANRQVKAAMLAHMFKALDEVWFHIGTDNIRSQKATAKLGAVYVGTEEIPLGGMGTDDWQVWRLDKDAWTP